MTPPPNVCSSHCAVWASALRNPSDRAFALLYSPGRSRQEFRAVLECGGLAPLSLRQLCILHDSCWTSGEKRGTVKAVPSHRSPKKTVSEYQVVALTMPCVVKTSKQTQQRRLP
jgi:hypothetical protein